MSDYRNFGVTNAGTAATGYATGDTGTKSTFKPRTEGAATASYTGPAGARTYEAKESREEDVTLTTHTTPGGDPVLVTSTG